MKNFGISIIAVCAITLMFFSCKKNGADYETILIDFDKTEIIDIRDSSKYAIRMIPLEQTDHSILTVIEQINLHGDKIFIYDTHRVMVFDMNGSYLFSIGRQGRGPGEYVSFGSFFLKDDNVYMTALPNLC